MEHKLTDITTSFHSFAEEQVLTHDQLNEFLDYFDEQDRMSRICLSGVGIVCGFNLAVKLGPIQNRLSIKKRATTVTISQGAGVTTDGDLIHLVGNVYNKENKVIGTELKSEIVYTHSRTYEHADVKYHPFFNAKDLETEFDLIPLIELVSKDDLRSTDEPLENAVLSNKIALFYLESYSSEPDNCVTVNCDNQGIEEVNKLRVLLVDATDVERITEHDSLFNSYITLESYLESKPVNVPRIILNKTNTSSIAQLAELYQKGTLLEESISNLRTGVDSILRRLGHDTKAANFLTRFNRIFQVPRETRLVSFQYKYDLLKDLADSYNEMKSLFLENYKTCCPDITAFPKHLLLGKVIEDEPRAEVAELVKLTTSWINPKSVISPKSDELEFRHKFHKSPILLDTDDGNGRFESILQRILDMIDNSDLDTLEKFNNQSITITPSNVRVPLGKRSIPFYYLFSQQLIQNWDYDKRKFDRFKSTLGYRLAPRSNDLSVSNPLLYSLDPYDFYRIEGHQGLPYDDVFQSLTDLKKTNSLPFDIKVLGIGVEEFDELLEDQYKCDFKDLGVLLQAWSSEQICISEEVADVLSSFSTKTPGKNLKEETYFDIHRKRAAVINRDMIQTDYATAGNIVDLSSPENEKSTVVNTEANRSFTTAFDPSASTSAAAGSTSAGPTVTPSPAIKAVATYNPVLEYINNTPDTIGFVLNQSIVQAKGNYSNALLYTDNLLGPIISTWDVRVAASTVRIPLQILVATTSLIGLIPTSIDKLTDSTLEDYNLQIALLCSYTKQLQAKYREQELAASVSDTTRSMVSLLINQLTTICCSSKKLQALLEEVERRKAAIVERLDFSNFVDKNPGLEHKAGVGPGQTFVIVYVNKTISKSITSTNIYTGGIRYPFPIQNAGIMNKTAAIASLDRLNLTNKVGVNVGDRALIESPYIGRVAAEVLIQKGTIIADFTLPYLCCSDCAPISFVLPKIPVSLSLSADSYCIDDPNLELDLTIKPEDGVVTVVDAVAGVIIENGKLSIDKSIFPAALIGTVLTFKVDGENTEAELIVSEKPTIVIGEVHPTSNGFTTSVVLPESVDANTVTWSFLDAEGNELHAPIRDIAAIEVDFNDFTNDKWEAVNIVLTVETQPCGEVRDEHNYPRPERVIVELDQYVFCKGDDEEYTFSFDPDNGFVTVDGVGVSEDGLKFSPANLAVGEYILTATNGETIKVTIVEKGSIKIGEITKEENGFSTSVTLSKDVSSDSVVWEILHETGAPLIEKIEGETEITIDFADFKDENWTTIHIICTVTTEPCGDISDSAEFSREEDDCSVKMGDDLDAIQENAPSRAEITEHLQNGKLEDEIFKMYDLLEEMQGKMDSVLNGSMNNRIVVELEILANILAKEIVQQRKDENESLVLFLSKLYRMLVGIFGSAFRCQDEFDYSKYKLGLLLNKALKEHFTETNENSFIANQIVVFNAANSAPFKALIEEKGNKTEPWTTINFIINAKSKK